MGAEQKKLLPVILKRWGKVTKRGKEDDEGMGRETKRLGKEKQARG